MIEPEIELADGLLSGAAGVLFQQAGAGLLLIEPLTERVLDANPTVERLSEFSRAELCEMALRSLIRHEQRWHDWTPPPSPGDGGAGRDGFLLRSRHAGRWIPVSVGTARVELDDGEAALLVRLGDRREGIDFQRRAHRAEADLRHALAAASACLWSCRIEPDGRWTYRYLSPAVERLTGRPPRAFLGAPGTWQQVVDPEDVPAWRDFRDRLAAGNPGALEYRLLRDGEAVRVRERVTVAPGEGGLVLHGVVDELPDPERARGEVRSRVDAFARLLGAVAHELNNLTTGILGQASLSRLRPPPGRGAGAIDEIEAIALKTVELSSRLATCAGRRRGRAGTADPAAEVRRVVAGLGPAAGAARLQVVAGVGLPGVAPDGKAFARAAEALIRNALECDSRNVIVRLEATRDAPGAAGAPLPLVFAYPGTKVPTDDWVCLSVRDDGAGLSADARGHLGEPFFSTRGPRRGLGLATALGVARAFGGAVLLHSRPGAGTCASLALPAHRPAADAVPAVSARADRGVVLLADDELSVLDVVARLLTSAGCSVVTAGNGEEALACYRRHAGEVRLALIDLSMPRMSGDRVARELRGLSAGLPIVLMSGHPDPGMTPQLADLHLAGYLQKPFRLPTLLDLLAKLLPG